MSFIFNRRKPASKTPPPTTIAPDPNENVPRLILRFYGSSHLPLSIPLQPRLVVGRGSDSDSTEIHIDLTKQGAAEQGVSRRHAAFTFDGQAVWIEDLNSTSGTRINGFRIVAHRPYRLRNSDELEFGELRVVVRLHNLK